MLVDFLSSALLRVIELDQDAVISFNVRHRNHASAALQHPAMVGFRCFVI
jgi:hypothetical protein